MVFDIFRSDRPRKGTGMWPLVYPRPWDLEPEAGQAFIVDSVAVAQEAAFELRQAGWPGIGLMDDDFRMSLLQDGAGVAGMAEAWFEGNLRRVGDEIKSRVQGYGSNRLSSSVIPAVDQAADAYARGRYLAIVRVLMPEIEGMARTMVTDRTKRTSQTVAVKDFMALLRETPIIKEEPLETMSMYEFIDTQLFAVCHTEMDAQAFKGAPNRHAELHALDSYGTLRGASLTICAIDVMCRYACRLLDLGHQPPSGTRT